MNFKEWMLIEGLSKSSSNKYFIAINGFLSNLAARNAISSKNLLDVNNLDEFIIIATKIRKLPKYIERNERGHSMYNAALSQYERFLSRGLIKEGKVDYHVRNITQTNIQELINNFEFDEDIRTLPDSYRRGQFFTGWQNATLKQKTYMANTLNQLTWNNLGYRLGTQFGLLSNKEIDAIFDICAEIYESLDDLTSDDIESPSPDRVKTTTNRIIRDTELARNLKKLHRNKCQICNQSIELTGAKLYSEAHHLKPLGMPHNGPDIEANIIILCPNHHAMCDYFAIELDIHKLRIHNKHQIGESFLDYHNKQVNDKKGN